MRKCWLTPRGAVSTKQVLYIILFFESVAVTIAISSAVISGQSPHTHFGEKGFISTISFMQLLLTAILSGKIYQIAKYAANPQLGKTILLRLVISLGLVFLALDETLSIHEQVDSLAHDWLRIEETNITDLADDLLVGLYLLLFLIYIFFQRRKIYLFKSSFIFFILGLSMAGMMVVCDLASNNSLFTSIIIDNAAQERLARQWLGVIEDSAKIFAEGMFIVGIYKCWQIAASVNSDR